MWLWVPTPCHAHLLSQKRSRSNSGGGARDHFESLTFGMTEWVSLIPSLAASLGLGGKPYRPGQCFPLVPSIYKTRPAVEVTLQVYHIIDSR